MVEEVEELGAELHVHCFVEWDVLDQGEIRVDEAWTVRPAELAQQLGLTVEAVDRLAKAGILAQPDSEGRLSLRGSVRALVALAAAGKAVESGQDGRHSRAAARRSA